MPRTPQQQPRYPLNILATTQQCQKTLATHRTHSQPPSNHQNTRTTQPQSNAQNTLATPSNHLATPIHHINRPTTPKTTTEQCLEHLSNHLTTPRTSYQSPSNPDTILSTTQQPLETQNTIITTHKPSKQPSNSQNILAHHTNNLANANHPSNHLATPISSFQPHNYSKTAQNPLEPLATLKTPQQLPKITFQPPENPSNHLPPKHTYNNLTTLETTQQPQSNAQNTLATTQQLSEHPTNHLVTLKTI